MGTMDQILNEFYIFIYLFGFILFALFLFFFGIYKIDKTKKYFPYILFVAIGAILSFLYFKNFGKLNDDDLNRYEHNATDLLIGFKNQNPCFYFSDKIVIQNGYIDYVEVSYFDINGTEVDRGYRYVWSVYDKNNNIPKKEKLTIENITGKENCLEYGDKRVVKYSSKPKDLNKNNLYDITIHVKSHTDNDFNKSYSNNFSYDLTKKGE